MGAIFWGLVRDKNEASDTAAVHSLRRRRNQVMAGAAEAVTTTANAEILLTIL